MLSATDQTLGDKLTTSDSSTLDEVKVMGATLPLYDASEMVTSSSPLQAVNAEVSAQPTAHSTSKIDLSKYVPTQEIPKRNIEELDVSTPPPGTYYFPVVQLGNPQPILKYQERFSRPDVLPSRNAPFRDQLEACARRWAVWAAEIGNAERRVEVIKWISNCMENVWRQGLKEGVVVESSDDQKHKTHLPNQKQNKKRLGNPARTVILRSQSWKNSERYAITIGELEEAGISKDNFEELLQSQDLRKGEDLLTEILESIGRNEIVMGDWMNAVPKSTYNTWGRDLLLYCLFEVQWSRKELERLHRLLAGFSQANQQKNTIRRIDEEQERQDLFLAIALKLNALSSAEKGSSDVGSAKSTSSEAIDLDGEQDDDTAGPETDTKQDEFYGGAEEILRMDSATSGNVEPQDLMQVDEKNASTHSVQIPNKRAAAEENNAEFEDCGPIVKKQRLDDRMVEIQPNSEPQVVSEDHKAEVQNQSPVVQADNSQQPCLPPVAGPPTPKQRKQAYLRYVVGPEVNRLLEKAGYAQIDAASTDWQAMRLALVNAGVPIETRNELAREINKFSLAVALQPGTNNDTAPGLLLGQRLLNAIPDRGFTPQELQIVLAQFASPEVEDWKPVLLSVADFDMQSQTWHRKPEVQVVPDVSSGTVPHGPEHLSKKKSLKVVLHYTTSHNPQDFSSQKVAEHKGFRYRYTTQSALWQRKAMDEVLESYIEQRKRPVKIYSSIQGPRYGRYEEITHPNDPHQTAIIHGYWDEKGGSLAEGSEWFFNGLEHPVHHESSLASRQEELMDTLLDRVSVQPRSQLASEVQVGSGIAPLYPYNAPVNPYSYQITKPAKKTVLNKSLKLRLTKPVNPFSGTSSASIKTNTKGKGRATDSTISTSRAKRGAATKARSKIYHDEYGSGDSEDEYQPYH